MKGGFKTLIGLVAIYFWMIAVPAAGADLDINPRNIDVGLIYNGSEITFGGTVPDGAEVYVKITSPDHSVMELNKKGKVGLFWLNTERSRVSRVPKLYHIVSSAPLSGLPEDLKQKLGLSNVFSDIYARAKVDIHRGEGWEPVPVEEAYEYVEAFVAISGKNGLYSVGEGQVDVGGSYFRGKVKLPPGIPQEKCSITVFAVKDGKLLDTLYGTFDVSGTGLVSWFNSMAVSDGPTYGLVAVVFALVFGVAITSLFNYIETLLSGGKKTDLSLESSH
ncbi:MAG: TIGR02186 family protein [Bacillota bacterium]